uniref:Uncharacterized protein n=1 Tax=Lutzomyia longipalpis TaxID=7200 RepID=A0A1B0CEU3_LUTLO
MSEKSPSVKLNIATCIHLILISNAMLSGVSTQAYFFSNTFFMVSLFWALHSRKSKDAACMNK